MTTAKTKFGRRSKKELIIIGLLGLAVIGTLFEDRLSSSVSISTDSSIVYQYSHDMHVIHARPLTNLLINSLSHTHSLSSTHFEAKQQPVTTMQLIYIFHQD